MDVKWIYIPITIFLVAMAGSMMWENYTKGQCRQEAIKAGKSADDIQKICR